MVIGDGLGGLLFALGAGRAGDVVVPLFVAIDHIGTLLLAQDGARDAGRFGGRGLLWQRNIQMLHLRPLLGMHKKLVVAVAAGDGRIQPRFDL